MLMQIPFGLPTAVTGIAGGRFDCDEADETLQAGWARCVRCVEESSPHPCWGFQGYGETSSSICQRNWCAHAYADHED
jgi:hypothetical protein